MEKNKRLNIIIVILVICVIGLGGYLTYDKLLNKENASVITDESKLEPAKHALKVESLGDILEKYFAGEMVDNKYEINCVIDNDDVNTCYKICEVSNNYKTYSLSVTCSGCDEDLFYLYYPDYIIAQRTSDCLSFGVSFDILDKNWERLISLDGSFIDIVDGKIYYEKMINERIADLYYFTQKSDNIELKYIKRLDEIKDFIDN